MVILLSFIAVLLLALIVAIIWGVLHAQALARLRAEGDERDAARAAALAEAGVWPPCKPGV